MDIKEHKRNFQLERMILFSDAVFAIAITLLVIELKIPELSIVSNRTLANAILHALPHFLSFLMSFMVIGIYWVSHHRMFFYVINYNQRLIWLNLFFLFFIALMPFSSNIYGVYNGLNTAFFLYVLNISMVALCNFFMWNYISNPKNNLSHGLENPRLSLYYKLRAGTVPFCFFIGVIISLVIHSGWGIALSRMSPMLIFPAFSIIKRKFTDVV
jgi:TMEM175 potassium channel family protein